MITAHAHCRCLSRLTCRRKHGSIVLVNVIQQNATMQKQDKQVSYFYDEDAGTYMYNVAHPWRPHRTKLVHSLVEGYGLEKEMMVRRPRPRTREELTQFHADGEHIQWHNP